jgi:hypothetical protein
MTSSHREFDPDHIPIAFMITLRAHGTWLHGDRRGSVDRFHNRYGNPTISSKPVKARLRKESDEKPCCKADSAAAGRRVPWHPRNL